MPGIRTGLEQEEFSWADCQGLSLYQRCTIGHHVVNAFSTSLTEPETGSSHTLKPGCRPEASRAQQGPVLSVVSGRSESLGLHCTQDKCLPESYHLLRVSSAPAWGRGGLGYSSPCRELGALLGSLTGTHIAAAGMTQGEETISSRAHVASPPGNPARSVLAAGTVPAFAGVWPRTRQTQPQSRAAAPEA